MKVFKSIVPHTSSIIYLNSQEAMDLSSVVQLYVASLAAFLTSR